MNETLRVIADKSPANITTNMPTDTPNNATDNTNKGESLIYIT